MKELEAAKFKPTDDMLSAANALFIAMAARDCIKPIVLGYQTKVLQRNKFKYDPKWVDNGRVDTPKSTDHILDPSRSYLMSELDFRQYHAECDQERIAAKLALVPPSDCPLLYVELQVSQAENYLVECMESITGFNVEQYRMIKLDSQRELVDLTLRLLAPFIDKDAVLAEMTKASTPH